jgi:hypothetical protein
MVMAKRFLTRGQQSRMQDRLLLSRRTADRTLSQNLLTTLKTLLLTSLVRPPGCKKRIMPHQLLSRVVNVTGERAITIN